MCAAQITWAAYPKDMKFRQFPSKKNTIPARRQIILAARNNIRATGSQDWYIPTLHVWKCMIGFNGSFPFDPLSSWAECLSLCNNYRSKLFPHEAVQGSWSSTGNSVHAKIRSGLSNSLDKWFHCNPSTDCLSARIPGSTSINHRWDQTASCWS